MSSDAIRLYTVREAASILKVHERTVLRWVRTGLLPARRIGRQIRIDEESLRNCGEPISVEQDTARRARRTQIGEQPGQPRKGSPEALLECVGMLTEEEAETLMRAIRQAHDEDWEERS
jgi:excisionase family DNA binding protein